LALIAAWRAEGRTVIAALHEFDIVRQAFPKTLLLARETIFWGDTAQALSPENLNKAKDMAAAYDARARLCDRDEAEHAHAV
jgi:zinc/manganese transport system ATP-binding protein